MSAMIKFEWTQMRPRAWHHLDELFAGQCDGMTYEEIEVQEVFKDAESFISWTAMLLHRSDSLKNGSAGAWISWHTVIRAVRATWM